MLFGDEHSEAIFHPVAPLITVLYRILGGAKRWSVAGLCFKLLFRLEGGAYRSGTVRNLLARDYHVHVALHSYGECVVPGAFAPSVVIGRYTSVAQGVRVFTQNHPTGALTTHPYFYERRLGYVEFDRLSDATTTIGNDVWIGQGVILLPGCRTVGTGAIIGAGAIVCKDVPPYAIVAGNPAKVIKFRFPKATVERLLQSRWWERPASEVMHLVNTFDLEQRAEGLAVNAWNP